MKLSTAQKWLRTLAWLRRVFPARFPVAVRSQEMKKNNGETEEFSGPRFIIRINRRTSHTIRIDTILHEWAHLLTWYGAGHYEKHPDEFGLQWGKIYNAFDKWDYGRKK